MALQHGRSKARVQSSQPMGGYNTHNMGSPPGLRLSTRNMELLGSLPLKEGNPPHKAGQAPGSVTCRLCAVEWEPHLRNDSGSSTPSWHKDARPLLSGSASCPRLDRAPSITTRSTGVTRDSAPPPPPPQHSASVKVLGNPLASMPGCSLPLALIKVHLTFKHSLNFPPGEVFS